MATTQRRLQGQPIYVLSEGSQRTHGKAAQDSNIAAGRAVATAVRTTLGPRGMDKMLVDASGTVVITNDGATILEEMDIEHPAAQMIVEVAETQEDEVGDGTTTAAVLTGQLLAKADALLDQDVYPTTIVEGYEVAARFAQEAIDGQVLDVEVDDDVLQKVAASSMVGKATGSIGTEELAAVVVDAVRHVYREGERFDREMVRVHAQTGASTAATELVEGVVLGKGPATDDVPRTVEDAALAVLDLKLDVRKGEVGAQYEVTSVDQLTAALDAEDAERRGYASTLKEAGVDVVVCSKAVDDRVASYLSHEGIVALKNVTSSDVSAIAKATGATRVGTLDGFGEDDLGHADRVRVERYGDEDLTFVEGGAAAEAVTLLVRGSTEHVVQELERAVGDAVDVVVTTLKAGEVVPGAGATEIAVADYVREKAASVEGRKQLAVEAFADAVDAIPLTLAQNAGLDPIDAIVDLRAAFEREGRAGLVVDGNRVAIGDPVDAGVIEPAAVKREAVGNATEAARMILRIDDVIAAK